MFRSSKIISGLIILVLLSSAVCFPVAVRADEPVPGNPPAVLTAASGQVNAGESITLAVSLSADSHACGGNFSIAYDKAKVEAVAIEAGALLQDDYQVQTNLNYAADRIRVAWAGTEPLTASGAVVAVTFKTKTTAGGTADMVLENINLYDNEQKAMSVTSADGAITIGSPAAPTFFVNSASGEQDGSVTLKVSLSAGSNAYGGSFNIKYDPTVLEVVSGVTGSVIPANTTFINPEYDANKIRVAWADTVPVAEGGELCTITFKSRPDASGSSVLELENTKLLDFNAAPMADLGVVYETGAVSGHVRDASGIGIEGVSVKLYDSALGEVLGPYYTDATGHWTCADARFDHSYQISFYHSRYSFGNRTLECTIRSEGIAVADMTGEPADTSVVTDAADFTYEVLDEGYISITGYTGEAADIIIPSEIDGYVVQVIAAAAFKGRTDLSSVVLPDSLETISDNSFASCTKLTAVTIPARVTALADNCFADCPQLTLYCYSNSAAYYAAVKNGYTCRLVDDHEHAFTTTIKTEPTCTSGGAQSHTCSTCGYNVVKPLEPLEHTFGEWITRVEPTLLSPGLKYRLCTVCSHEDTMDLDPLTIDISETTEYGQANFTVVDATNLKPIAGACLFVATENDGEATMITDANGKVSQVLPVGQLTISAYAQGFLTRTLKVTVTPGEQDIPKIGLGEKPLVRSELTVTEMTKDEIVAAGIDVTDPANQQVKQYTVGFSFNNGTDTFSIKTYFNADGKYLLGKPATGGTDPGGGTTPGDGVIYYHGPNQPHSGSDSGIGFGYTLSDKTEVTIFPVSEQCYMIVYGEVKRLKEMFEVELMVLNSSLTDTVKDCVAELVLPEGLSLAAMAGGAQSSVQTIAHIAANDSGLMHWYLRGDQEGTYSIAAKVSGMLMPHEEEFSYEYQARDPIKVYAGSAMPMTSLENISASSGTVRADLVSHNSGDSGDPVSMTVYCAVYDLQGKMLALRAETMSMTADKPHPLTFNFNDLTETATTYKLFVLSTDGSHKPITAAYEGHMD